MSRSAWRTFCIGWVLLYGHRNRWLTRDGSPGRPTRLSHSSWALLCIATGPPFFTPCNENSWNHTEFRLCPDDFLWTAQHCVTMDTFCNQLWLCIIISDKWSILLSSRSRSQWGLMLPKYDCFNYIFWTNHSFAFATKFCFMVDNCQPECLVKGWIDVFKVKVTAMVKVFS